MSSPLDRALSYIWNREEHRPRAPFRLVAVAVVFLLVGQVTGPLFAALSGQYRGGVFAVLFAGTTLDVAIQTGSSLFGALTAVISAAILALGIDRRRFSDYGFGLDRAWWRDFGFGAALGGGLMTLLFFVLLGAGWLRVTGFGVASEGFSPGVLVVSYLLTFAGVSLSGTGPSYVAVGSQDALESLAGHWNERDGTTWHTTTRQTGCRTR